MLHITQSGSFKMDRKMKDGSIQPNSRRYAYTVSGNAAEIAQFKRDIAEGTNKGAQLLENGELRYYSWRKCMGNVGVLLRSKQGNWFIDTAALDDLESLSEQSPALMKALGNQIINMIIPQRPIEKAEPVPVDNDDDNSFPE
jgi:hypothetical protein